MRLKWVVLGVVCLGLLLACQRGESAAANDGRRAEVLKYLTELPQKSEHKVLSGQQAGDSQPVQNPFSAQAGYAKYVEALHARCGRRPAVVGFGYDALALPVQPLSNLLAVNAVAKAHWNQGGLVELGVAAHSPFTGGSANEPRPAGRRLTELLVTGSEANRRWQRQLDDVATALADLQQAGVVVLWRVFPEFNGNWFWWGAADDGQDFIAVWRQMHDYLTQTRHLDNLLWVWAGCREAGPWMQPLLKYYPGPAYVDIVALDMYHDTFDAPALKAYRDLTALGKPFALAEYGPDNKTTTPNGTLDLPGLIRQIRESMPNTVYFKFFSDYIVPPGYRGPAHNMYWSMLSNRRPQELLSDPWVANAEDLPRFGRDARTNQR